MKIKKMILVALAVIMLLSLVACQKQGGLVERLNKICDENEEYGFFKYSRKEVQEGVDDVCGEIGIDREQFDKDLVSVYVLKKAFMGEMIPTCYIYVFDNEETAEDFEDELKDYFDELSDEYGDDYEDMGAGYDRIDHVVFFGETEDLFDGLKVN